ncbi:MAG TPA: AAA family ATPase [Candidatus Dormibacteraeota bacterium]|nr:AAA family ATPase [Candidatus Dormibacteraeota bacterium]
MPLRPKTWAVLLYLAQRPGALVSRDEILDAVWPDVAVTPDTLTKSIGELRIALGDDPREPRFIETAHRRGFRFLATPRATTTPSPAARGETPFVGREDELRRLAQCFERACRGERQIVFIAGPAGLGKTSLLEAFLRSLATHPSAPRIGAGTSIEQHGPREAYMPVLEALGRLAGGADAASLVGRLRATAPSWLVQMPWLAGDDAAALERSLQSARPERMLREGVALLEAAASEAPLVLALEDLHWSDPSTVDLLTRIGQRRESARLLLIATYRAAEVAVHEHPLGAAVRTLRGQRLCTAISLDELTHDAVRRYLETRFPGTALPPGLVDALHAHSEGNPLFLRAIVDHLLARGWILDTAPGWSFDAMPARPDLGVPDDARDVVALQIASLGPADRRLLEAASVAGRDCTASVLAAALARPVEDVEASGESLALAERFLRLAADARGPRWSFTHELYRQAVYHDIQPARRQRLHLRVGQALETELGERADELAPELAHHFERGGDPGRALRYLAMAAARARHRLAPREAGEYLAAALALVERLPDAAERRRWELDLRVALAPVLMERSGPASDALLQNAERALALGEGVSDPRQLFQILYGLAHVHAMRGDPARLDAIIDALAGLAEQTGSADQRLMLQTVRLRTNTYRARFAEACREAELIRAAARAGAVPHAVPFGADPVVGSLSHYAWSSWMMGEVDRARAIIREVGETVGEAAPFTRAAAGVFACLLGVLDRDAPAVLHASDANLPLSEEYGFAQWTPVTLSMRGWARAQLGDGTAGLDDLERAQATYAEMGAQVFATYMRAFAAEAHLQLGDVDAGLRAVDDGLRIADTTIDRSFAPELWRVKGEILLAADRALEAETCLHQAIEVARAAESRMLEVRAAVSLARHWLATEQAPRARALLTDATREFAPEVDSSELREARALLEAHPAPAKRPRARTARRS